MTFAVLMVPVLILAVAVLYLGLAVFSMQRRLAVLESRGVQHAVAALKPVPAAPREPLLRRDFRRFLDPLNVPGYDAPFEAASAESRTGDSRTAATRTGDQSTGGSK